MKTKKMKALAEADLKVWNTGNLELYDKILSPKIIRHEVDIQEDIVGIEANKENVTIIRTGFPDFKVKFKDLIIKNKEMVARWTATGSNTGLFGSLMPTGKKVKISGVTISRIVKKRIQEQWVYYNQAEFLKQLGIDKALYDQMNRKSDETTHNDRRVSPRIKQAAAEASKEVNLTEPKKQKTKENIENKKNTDEKIKKDPNEKKE